MSESHDIKRLSQFASMIRSTQFQLTEVGDWHVYVFGTNATTSDSGPWGWFVRVACGRCHHSVLGGREISLSKMSDNTTIESEHKFTLRVHSLYTRLILPVQIEHPKKLRQSYFS